MELKDRIRIAIEESGMRKIEISRKLDISPSSITQWLNGDSKKINGNNLIKLAEVTRVDPVWLATGRGQMRSGEVREASAPELNPRQVALLGLFDGLTASQQDDMMRKFEAEKQRNDALIDELMAKRRA